MFGLLAACGGDDGGRPIVDGQGSGSGSATGFGGAVTLVLEDEGSAYASAAFYTGTPTQFPPSCTTVTDGPCSLTTCPTPPTPAVTYDDAGAITITGGTPTTVMALGEAADHSYTYPLQDTGTIYTGTFAIAGTGATVPAFTQSVTMPTAIEVDAPTNAAPIQRSSDLTITWSHGAQDDLFIYELYQGPYTVLSCALTDAGDAGSYTIASSLLQGLAAGNATSIGFGYATANAMVGDYATVFQTGSIAHTSLGGEYNVSVILQ